jgi:hypothetical protein
MDNLEQREKQLKQRKTLSDLLIVLVAALCILVIGGGVGWHYFYGPCGVTRVEDAGHVLRDQVQVYDDAYNIAASTARISLAGPVAELQRILRETENIEVPSCMEKAKNELVLSIDDSVKAFLAFMSEESDIAVGSLLDSSVTHLGNFNKEMDVVDACKPFCQSKNP